MKELAGNVEAEHLDADVDVRAHTTWRVEDVAWDAAAAEQAETSMKSFASSTREVFEKIEESLRQCKRVEDLNDDDTMELCIVSNDLNACKTTAILNPSRFVSHVTRLGIREGFEVDLTAARPSGTAWDFSHEDDRTARASCGMSAK